MEIFLLILFGAIAGVLGGMGMGGGTLLIPLLTIFLNIDQHVAQGINLLVFLPMAIVALIFHFKNKLVEIKKTWVMIICAVASSIGGSFLSFSLKSEQLRIYFAIFLIVLGIFQFVSIFIFRKNFKQKTKRKFKKMIDKNIIF